MNVVTTLSIALLGLTSLTGLASAQTASVPPSKVNALVQLKKGKAARIAINSASGASGFIYTQSGRAMQANLKDCNLFMFETPSDLVSALTKYRSGDLKAARTSLGNVKKKYSATLGLPNDPAGQAAYYELLAAIRLQDWASVKSLAANYPKAAAKSDRKKLLLRVASLMGELTSPGAALQGKIESLLKDKNLVRSMDLEYYGFLRYALAQSIIAQLPPAAVKGSSLSGDDATKAIKAVDLLCEAVVCQHGANRDFAVDALVQASKLLWSLKDVHAYLVDIGLNVEMNEGVWKKAPVNFREAVTLAFMAKTLADSPLKDNDLEKIVRYYFGPAKETLAKN